MRRFISLFPAFFSAKGGKFITIEKFNYPTYIDINMDINSNVLIFLVPLNPIIYKVSVTIIIIKIKGKPGKV